MNNFKILNESFSESSMGNLLQILQGLAKSYFNVKGGSSNAIQVMLNIQYKMEMDRRNKKQKKTTLGIRKECIF